MEKLKATLESIERIDFSLAGKTQKRLDNLTKPPGSLGRLEELAKQIVEISGIEKPTFKNKVIFTFAGDHGIAQEGVSAYPQAVTAQMVYNFLNGGAGINVLARHIGARVVVADLGVAAKIEKAKSQSFIDKKVGFGTKNMAVGRAMTIQEAVNSIEAGMEIFEKEYKKGIDILGTGDMGISNTTASSAIASAILNKPVEELTGKGTGINDSALKHKVALIKKALEINKPNAKDAIDVLSKVGGFEIGGLSGVILAAASKRVPVIVDGFISGAAALIAYTFEPKIKDYLIAAHCSVEKGHRAILDYLGLKPILDLNLRLGEGTGAALAMSIVEAAVKILNEMATFGEAGVSESIT